MRVTTGRVVDGRIEVAGETFAEGLTVTIIAPEGRETFEQTWFDRSALTMPLITRRGLRG